MDNHVILFELECPFAPLLIPTGLHELGIKHDSIFQSVLVYRVNNVFLNFATTSVAFGPVRIGLEW